eukprot:567425-Pyramimonas_sp.AAC.1
MIAKAQKSSRFAVVKSQEWRSGTTRDRQDATVRRPPLAGGKKARATVQDAVRGPRTLKEAGAKARDSERLSAA